MENSTRIRYTKQENGSLVSKEMLAREHIVTAVLYPESKSFSIVAKDGTVLGKGIAKTMADAKKILKAELKSIGVQFHDEVRNTKVETKGVENV